MGFVDIGLLVAVVLLSLLTREAMKRIARRKLGKGSYALLELDFWRATTGEGLTRCLLFVELLSWAATAFLVASLAGQALLK